MRGRTIGLAVVMAVAVGLLAAPADDARKKENKSDPKNLCLNGDFEKGTDTPDGWQRVDGLTTFWVDDPDGKRGKIIKVDTDVLQSQGYDWWVKIARGARAKDAPRKLPTTPPKYDTLAGLDGVWFWSDFIPVEKGKAYWLTVDIKGEPDVMAWLVGYESKESTAFGADAGAFQEFLKEKTAGKPKDNVRLFEGFINKYTWRGQLNARYAKPLENGWRRWTRDKLPFRPTKMTPKVRFVRVLLLPYWPPGVCYIDNVRLTEVEEK
ncbi:MAG: hypothetical protein U0736_03260 [Gemmataceae bacterium]